MEDNLHLHGIVFRQAEIRIVQIKQRGALCPRQGQRTHRAPAQSGTNRVWANLRRPPVGSERPEPNHKWLTDVTEFKYYVGIEVKKVYLSAILDLYDRRIVSYVIRDTNDNPLVFDTFRAAIAANPEAHPLCHSDRGFQYTCRSFHHMLKKPG